MDYTLTQLEQVVTLKTIIVNLPGNPSSRVFAREELEVVAGFARRHDLFVFIDEIYEYFLCDGRLHLSIAALPDMIERTNTIGGYSKTFSVTGWRVGNSVGSGHRCHERFALCMCPAHASEGRGQRYQ